MSQESLIETSFDLKDDYERWLPIYQDAFQELAEMNPNWLKFSKVLDCGCGYGASTLAMSRVLTGSQIYAVSLGERPLKKVSKELGKRLHFSSSKIINFLSNSNELFDLVLFMRIPYSGISKDKDYKLLHRRVSQRGFVFVIGDSTLNDQMMKTNGFTSIEIPKKSFASVLYLNRMWVK